jgi:NADPH:quinone reductase-like Zn-dependent oxidoreductase
MTIPKTMRAAVLTAHGGPEVLEVRDDVPVPKPSEGQVLVRVTAAAVNNTDLWTREGAYGAPGDPDAVAGWRGVPISVPRIQGGDIAGTIAACGDDVDDARLARRVVVDPTHYDSEGDDASVVALLGSEFDGGFAQFVVVEDHRAHDVTDSPLTDEQLACLPIAYGTAMGMLERAQLRGGETVCVTGASGGVGHALVELASARDARVIAVTSEGNADAVAAAGADEVVLRNSADVGGAVRDLAGNGLDCVADVVGGDQLTALLDALRVGGRIVIAGAIAGPVIQLDLRRLYLHQRRLIGSTMHTPAHFARLVEVANAGDVAPVVAGRYGLADIAEAQADFVHSAFVGKLVLVP